jgi:hypothetical protein
MIRADFSWTPTTTISAVHSAGNTYPYTTQADAIVRSTDTRYATVGTPVNTLITFTATAVSDKGVITEYKWDLGDGSIAFGPSVAHIYKVASTQGQVSLIVTDSVGDRVIRSRPLSLRNSGPVLVVPGVNVG